MHLVAQWRADARRKRRTAGELLAEADALPALLDPVAELAGPATWQGPSAHRFARQLGQAQGDMCRQQSACRELADALQRSAREDDQRADERERALHEEAARRVAGG